ncbi:hypothetical protein RJT34_24659 [Clitoria ternatea]|uniref:Uncharacterized protein n=1 Tax=Clitoria ternatea TaxID=43366 RepID=A0AAN9FR31_CLITE
MIPWREECDVICERDLNSNLAWCARSRKQRVKEKRKHQYTTISVPSDEHQINKKKNPKRSLSLSLSLCCVFEAKIKRLFARSFTVSCTFPPIPLPPAHAQKKKPPPNDTHYTHSLILSLLFLSLEFGGDR